MEWFANEKLSIIDKIQKFESFDSSIRLISKLFKNFSSVGRAIKPNNLRFNLPCVKRNAKNQALNCN